MDLSTLTRKPQSQWFHWKDDPDIGIDLVTDENDQGENAIVSLKLEYVTPRQYQEMIQDAVKLDRKAINRKGVKAIMADQNKAREIVCKRLIQDWHLTVAGAYALQFPGDFDGYKPTDTIEFTPDNLNEMASKGDLSLLVHQVMSDHSLWFKAPKTIDERLEDSEGNSESGPSGSSAA